VRRESRTSFRKGVLLPESGNQRSAWSEQAAALHCNLPLMPSQLPSCGYHVHCSRLLLRCHVGHNRGCRSETGLRSCNLHTPVIPRHHFTNLPGSAARNGLSRRYLRGCRSESPPAERVVSGSPPKGGKRVAPGVSPELGRKATLSPEGATDETLCGNNSRPCRGSSQGNSLSGGFRPRLFSLRPCRARPF
jgi:hypothetical protein